MDAYNSVDDVNVDLSVGRLSPNAARRAAATVERAEKAEAALSDLRRVLAQTRNALDEAESDRDNRLVAEVMRAEKAEAERDKAREGFVDLAEELGFEYQRAEKFEAKVKRQADELTAKDRTIFGLRTQLEAEREAGRSDAEAYLELDNWRIAAEKRAASHWELAKHFCRTYRDALKPGPWELERSEYRELSRQWQAHAGYLGAALNRWRDEAEAKSRELYELKAALRTLGGDR